MFMNTQKVLFRKKTVMTWTISEDKMAEAEAKRTLSKHPFPRPVKVNTWERKYQPELRIMQLSIHNHGFKHGTLADDKFNHAMDQGQLCSERKRDHNILPLGIPRGCQEMHNYRFYLSLVQDLRCTCNNHLWHSIARKKEKGRQTSC